MAIKTVIGNDANSPTTDANGIRYYFKSPASGVVSSITGRASSEGQSYSVNVWTKFETQRAFLRDMVGYSYFEEGDTFTALDGTECKVLHRVQPNRWRWPNERAGDETAPVPLYCTMCDLVGTIGNGVTGDDRNTQYLGKPQPWRGPQIVDGDVEEGGYDYKFFPWPEYAEFQTTFSTLMYDVLTDDEMGESLYLGEEWKRNCIFRYRFAAELEKVPGGLFRKVNAAKTPIGETFSRRGAVQTLEIKLLDVPEGTTRGVTACANKVNDDPFILWPAETVRFNTAESMPRFNAYGERSYDITLNFSVRLDERTWNQFREVDGPIVDITSDGTVAGEKPFPSTDFTSLFQFEA